MVQTVHLSLSNMLGDVVIKRVSPNQGRITGGTEVSIYGDNLVDTESIRCKFSSINYTRIVAGQYNFCNYPTYKSQIWR